MDRDGHYCSVCLKKHDQYKRDNRAFLRENNICTVCGKIHVPGTERICPECRAKNESIRKPLTDEQKERYKKRFKEQQKKQYEERIQNGMCTRCGKRSAINGRKKCGICLSKNAEIHRKRNMNKINVREYREKNHLCYYCGKPLENETGKICKKCYDRCVENGYKGEKQNLYWKNDNMIIFLNGKKYNLSTNQNEGLL